MRYFQLFQSIHCARHRALRCHGKKKTVESIWRVIVGVPRPSPIRPYPAQAPTTFTVILEAGNFCINAKLRLVSLGQEAARGSKGGLFAGGWCWGTEVRLG